MRAAAMIYTAVVTAGCLAGAWFGADQAVRWLERSTTDAITDALAAGDNDWAKVEANGLHVLLTGTAPTESARARAFETLARLVDTSRIEEQTEVVADADDTVPAFNLEILRSGTDLSLIGVLPGTSARITVLDGFGEHAGNEGVTDLMEAVEFEPPSGWKRSLEFGIGAARELPQSRVVVTPGNVSVEAFLPSPADVAAAEQSLRSRLPDGTRLELDLLSPKPVMSPFRFGARAANGAFEVEICGVESEEGLILIENVLKSAGVADPACTLALGAPSPRWSEAVAGLVEALNAIGSGTAAIVDTDVVLEGAEGVTSETFETAAQTLQTRLPPMFSFRAIAPPEPLDTAAPAPPPPVFIAKLHPDGRFEMSGLVGDAQSVEALENYAAAHFGLAAVNSELKTDSRVPGGWSPRIFAALDAVARTYEGTLSMSAGQLTLTGTTYDESFAEAFVAIASERLQGFETDVTVTVEPRPELSPSGPSARECERQLAAILDVGQIIFLPSSAQITDANELILDEIAFVIQSCQTARFEIGGHTDSQGRESMNLSLSQARADALRDSLIERGIFPDLLIAKGYGESTPIADNDTDVGRATNRRIEFTLLGEGDAPDPAQTPSRPDANATGGEEAGPAQGDRTAGSDQARPQSNQTPTADPQDPDGPQAQTGDDAPPTGRREAPIPPRRAAPQGAQTPQ